MNNPATQRNNTENLNT